MATKPKPSKPMSEATKARLKATVAAAKGRSTLAVLERVGLAMALDALFEGRITSPPVTHSPGGPLIHMLSDGWVAKPSHLDANMRWTYHSREMYGVKPDKDKARHLIRWVKLRRAPADVMEMLKASEMERVAVTLPKYTGPHTRVIECHDTVFRADQVIMVFRFLFGEPAKEGERAKKMDWKKAVGKYLHGYTPAYIEYRLKRAIEHKKLEDRHGAEFIDEYQDD